MILEGKRIAFLGDSITEGVGVTDKENNRYDNVIKKECNLEQALNYGISGTRIAHEDIPNEAPEADLCFCGRLSEIDAQADAIVVFGGTNDYGHGSVPFGDLTDREPNTYCGAIDYLMRFLKENYAGRKFLFLTPTRREGDEYPSVHSNKVNDGKSLKVYVDVILEKDREHDFPVLNLYDNLGIDAKRQRKADLHLRRIVF